MTYRVEIRRSHGGWFWSVYPPKVEDSLSDLLESIAVGICGWAFTRRGARYAARRAVREDIGSNRVEEFEIETGP